MEKYKVTITEFLRKSGEYLEKADRGHEVTITSKRKVYRLKREDVK